MTRDPICPHCGNTVRDAWELRFGGSAEGTEEDFECGSCGGLFDIERHVDVHYTTKAKP